nr:uncharacterized protein LOC111413542 isoform X1 [Onthophagus taurus]
MGECNVLCCKKDRRRGPCNEVRFIEFFLSLLCLISALVASNQGHLNTKSSIHWVFAPLYGIPITYLFITFVDIIVTWTYFPIGWRAWILFSVGGGLLFLFCCGISPLIQSHLFFLYTLLYIITGFVFLMDGLCIVCMIRSLKLGTDQSQHQPCCNTACGHKATQIAPEINSVDSISQTDPNLQRKGPPIGDYNEYPSTQKRRNDPYQDREPQNMKGDYGRVKQESGGNEEKKDIVEKINDSKTVSAIQKTMWASRKLKPVDMTPLHNPFLAQSQINK